MGNVLRYIKLLALFSLMTLLLSACKKDHFNLGNVHGVTAEGEVLLPVGSASFSLAELMQQFNIGDQIVCMGDGNLSYSFHYENLGVVNGENLLRFDDLDYGERFSFENSFPILLPQAVDTMFHFDQTIVFASDNIHVMDAEMKSGHFDFDVNTNIGALQRIVLRSSNIKDDEGRDLSLDFDLTSSNIQFDLGGMHYETDSANALVLGFDVFVRLQSIPDQELFFEVNVKGRDLALKEMSGYVDAFESVNRIDTTLILFPGNASGALEVQGARMRIFERNTFGLGARLDVDTAWIIPNHLAPLPVFGSQSVSVDIPPLPVLGQIFERKVNAKIMANETGFYAVSNFIVNPLGMSELVSVSDTCVIDAAVDVEIPFAFAVDDVWYADTTDLNLKIEAPEQVEKLTLEMTFTSTVPVKMNAQFFTYDSVIGQITDTLVAENQLIGASYDGKPVTTEVTLVATGEKVDHLNHADRLISIYEIDTEAHDVCLNGEQQLAVFVKARVKYNTVVEF